MKKVLASVVCLCSFAALAANITNRVYLNGKLLGEAVTINGVPALPLEDLAKAAGLRLTTEPGLQLRGTTLIARSIPGRLKWQPITLKRGVDAAAAPSITLNKEGVISNNVMMFNGRAYVPVRDVAHALGGVWTPNNLAPGSAIQLNFTSNPNAILIGM